MKFVSTVPGPLRATLALAAAGAVLFLALVGGLHVHHHAPEDCYQCLQLDNLGLVAPDTDPETVTISAPSVLPDALPSFPGILISGGDTARAPPALS